MSGISPTDRNRASARIRLRDARTGIAFGREHSLREPTIACRRPGPERRTGAFSFPALRAPQLDEIAKV
jgi:hypothetical protein